MEGKELYSICLIGASEIYESINTAFDSMKECICALWDNLILKNESMEKILSNLSSNFLEKMRRKLAFPSDVSVITENDSYVTFGVWRSN